jgi:hypothetical protein
MAKKTKNSKIEKKAAKKIAKKNGQGVQDKGSEYFWRSPVFYVEAIMPRGPLGEKRPTDAKTPRQLWAPLFLPDA